MPEPQTCTQVTEGVSTSAARGGKRVVAVRDRGPEVREAVPEQVEVKVGAVVVHEQLHRNSLLPGRQGPSLRPIMGAGRRPGYAKEPFRGEVKFGRDRDGGSATGPDRLRRAPAASRMAARRAPGVGSTTSPWAKPRHATTSTAAWRPSRGLCGQSRNTKWSFVMPPWVCKLLIRRQIAILGASITGCAVPMAP